MRRKLCSSALVAVLCCTLLAQVSAADDPTTTIIKQNGYAVSLDLKFSKKNANSLQRALAFLDFGPNGFATGFFVGDHLVMTAYHVVSGELSAAKKVQLGFSPSDRLSVKAYVSGCEATVLRVDEEADLALLRICGSQKQAMTQAFQTTLSQDEKLLLIARPHGDKMVRWGVFSGPYMVRGQEYLSAKLDVRDGYSGSPVYNDKGELVGVYSGYDWSQKVALISPGTRAQKLIEDYLFFPEP